MLSLSVADHGRILGRQLTDRRPIERITAMSEQGQEAVPQQAGKRHRHAQVFRSRQGQPDVLEAKGCGEVRPARMRRRRSARHRSNRRARRTASRSRCRDTAACRCRLCPPMPSPRRGIPITAAIRKLPLSLTRLAACGVSETTNVFCPMDFEQRCCGVDRGGLAGGNDKELTHGRQVWAAEHRRRDKSLARLSMRRRQSRRQGDADRARRDVDGTGRQTGDDANVAEDDILHRLVVRQHGDHRVAPAGVGDARRRLSRPGTPVVRP